jgi:hypothetical protein
MKVDKDYVENVVKEDLSKKYPDITELEFAITMQHMQYKVWVTTGVLSTARGFTRRFIYFIDSETGEILGYVIS